MVGRLDARSEHAVVQDALTMLQRMSHRGGCCEPGSGDGAGLLAGLPHEFFQRALRAPLGLDAPLPRDRYAIGQVFHGPRSRVDAVRAAGRAHVEQAATAQGLAVLGWRAVPVSRDGLGPVARGTEPVAEQVVLTPPPDMGTDEFERRLFLVRQVRAVRLSRNALPAVTQRPLFPRVLPCCCAQLTSKDGATAGSEALSEFHLCSLSNQTIVYKGQLTPELLATFAVAHARPLLDRHARACLTPSTCGGQTGTLTTWRRPIFRRTSPWCTHGSAPTHSPRGRAPSRTGCSRTTERSTRSAEIYSGCRRARVRCLPAPPPSHLTRRTFRVVRLCYRAAPVREEPPRR